MPKFTIFNDEVLYATEPLSLVDGEVVDILIQRARNNPRKRCRMCFHGGPDSPFHDMLIVHGAGAYVPAHKHFGRSETLHVVDGHAIAVIFDESSVVVDAAEMSRDAVFHYHMPPDTFHSLLIESEWFVFQESTTGPFNANDSSTAIWSPDANDPAAVTRAQQDWKRNARDILARNHLRR